MGIFVSYMYFQIRITFFHLFLINIKIQWNKTIRIYNYYMKWSIFIISPVYNTWSLPQITSNVSLNIQVQELSYYPINVSNFWWLQLDYWYWKQKSMISITILLVFTYLTLLQLLGRDPFLWPRWLTDFGINKSR